MRLRHGLLWAAILATATPTCIFVSDVREMHHDDRFEGHFVLGWSTVEAETNHPVDCSLAGADTVRVRSTHENGGETYEDRFDCHAGHGMTGAVPSGWYGIDVELVACGDSPDCVDGAVLFSAASQEPYWLGNAADVDLGTFVFPVHTLVQ
jgi:hypothetical protein